MPAVWKVEGGEEESETGEEGIIALSDLIGHTHTHTHTHTQMLHLCALAPSSSIDVIRMWAYACV